MSTKKKGSFSFSPQKELLLSEPEDPDHQRSFSSIDLPQFREQLCLYLEPYRNSKLDWDVQGEMIRLLMYRYGRSCNGAQISLLAEVLSGELANFGIQVPSDIEIEKFFYQNN